MTLKCVYWDDDAADLNTFANTIRKLIRELRPNARTQLIEEVDLTRAIDLVRSDPTGIHLVFADLLVDGKSRGTRLINVAQEHNIPAIALSDGGYDDYAHAARSAGAAEYVSKRLLTEDPAEKEKLRGAIDRLLTWDADDSSGVPLEYDDEDVEICAILESIGLDKLTRILKEMFAGRIVVSVALAPVSAGRSGAVVLRADVNYKDNEASNSRIIPLLLKASENERLIVREAEQYQAVTERFAGRIIPQLWSPQPVKVAEWTSIGMKFQIKATTISHWLASGPRSSTEIEQVFKRLFGPSGLGETYSATLRLLKQRPSQEIGKVFVVGRRAHALRSLKLILPLLEKYSDAPNSAANLEKFIADPAYNRMREKRETYTAYQHGDLHGDNILIDQNLDPLVIDPLTAGTYHWALDISRLIAHLTAVLHTVGPEAYEWENFAHWSGDIRSVLDGHVPAPHNSALSGAHWLMSNVGWIFPAVPADHYPEVHACLAGEYLRVSARENIPMPSRVLAADLAAFLLERSGT